MAQKLIFLPGPWNDVLSSRLSLERSRVAGGHHVLNVVNQRVTGGRHDGLTMRKRH